MENEKTCTRETFKRLDSGLYEKIKGRVSCPKKKRCADGKLSKPIKMQDGSIREICKDDHRTG